MELVCPLLKLWSRDSPFFNHGKSTLCWDFLSKKFQTMIFRSLRRTKLVNFLAEVWLQLCSRTEEHRKSRQILVWPQIGASTRQPNITARNLLQELEETGDRWTISLCICPPSRLSIRSSYFQRFNAFLGSQAFIGSLSKYKVKEKFVSAIFITATKSCYRRCRS